MESTIDLNLKKMFLKQQACFSQLTDKEIEGLAGLLTEKHFAAKEVIVTEGDPVDSVYLIVNGTADVRLLTIKDSTTESKSIATLGVGEAIGLNDTGFYSLTGKRTATVVALSDMLLLCLRIPEFHGFSLANPHVGEVMRKNSKLS